MTQKFFLEGTQPSRKIMEIPGGGGWGYDKHPLEWKLQGLGGLKQIHRVPSQETKITTDLGILFSYCYAIVLGITGYPPKIPSSLGIWVSSCHISPVQGSQIVGKTRKWKTPQFPPVLFSRSLVISYYASVLSTSGIPRPLVIYFGWEVKCIERLPCATTPQKRIHILYLCWTETWLFYWKLFIILVAPILNHSMHAALDVFSMALVMKPNPIVELHIFRHSYDKQIHVFPATKIWSLSSSSYAFFLFETVYYKVQKRRCSY